MAPIPGHAPWAIRRHRDRIRFVGIHPVNVSRAVRPERISTSSRSNPVLGFRRSGGSTLARTCGLVSYHCEARPLVNRPLDDHSARKKHGGVGTNPFTAVPWGGRLIIGPSKNVQFVHHLTGHPPSMRALSIKIIQIVHYPPNAGYDFSIRLRLARTDPPCPRPATYFPRRTYPSRSA